MVSVSLQSLQQLCSIRIAYLMWTRHDLNIEFREKDPFDRLVDIVTADVQNLPLPKQVKPPILQIVKPVGQRLLHLLDSWLEKTQPENGEKWLTGEMLFDCLILNADGLINERKTAEKILSSIMLVKCSRIYAFRLACVNCLEKEVLQLWILVREYLLRKVLTESGDPNRLAGSSNYLPALENYPVIGKSWEHFLILIFSGLNRFSSTTESGEVLFWLSYCLSKENAFTIEEVPHFSGKDVDWYEYSLQSADFSSTVAWLDYFINICKREVEYDYAGKIKGRLFVDEKKKEPSLFIFHYILLDSEMKAELFRVGPKHMVNYFLQWPLSQTFVENANEIWNLIPYESKAWVFRRLFAILFHENPLQNPITDYRGRCIYLPTSYNNVIHSAEHLRRIWIALWKISLNSHKRAVLESLVFRCIIHSETNGEFSTSFEFITSFEASDLKNKLLDLFLSNGEAVLELYEGKTMKGALTNLISKYMPDDFEDLDREHISYFKHESEDYIEELEGEMQHKIRHGYSLDLKMSLPRNQPKPVHDEFLNFIKRVVYFN